MKLVFLGPPGAGKGTQADRVCEAFDIAHISTGDMLRGHMQRGTQLGVKARGYVEAGNLVPDELIIDMVKERVLESDCKNGFLLDGFPRTVAQADALEHIANIDMAINIDVPASTLVNRISGRRMCRGCGAAYHIASYSKPACEKCGGELYIRDDDKPETVLNRITVYNEKTQPLIDYYEVRGNLHTVNGDRPPEMVLGDISALVAKLV